MCAGMATHMQGWEWDAWSCRSPMLHLHPVLV